MTLDFRNINTLWSSVLVETLSRLGLTVAVVCPGSRSSPLTVAFAQHSQVEAIPILDERSAAFFALGLAKQLGQPVALLCTSGTATANFYPAVIEAKESKTPLLILTADRPPELRHCHAGQTIDQLKLYGNYPNWQAEISCPSPTLNRLNYLRQTLIQAWERCLYPLAGVVHLNLPFRDPLAPIPDLETANLEANFSEDSFFSHLSLLSHRQSIYVTAIPTLPQKGIIIAGVAHSKNPKTYCQAIAHLAQFLQYPVLAEALSPLRNYAEINPYLVTTYDLLLRHSHLADKLIPDVVIQIGELPTSKELRVWLERIEIDRYIIDPSPDNFDALHGKTIHLRTTVEQLAKSLPSQEIHDSEYCQIWCSFDQMVRKNIDQRMKTEPGFIEGKVSWLLSQYLPSETPVFIANSMSVRHAEFFWLPNNRQIIPYFSRGANGIDGTLSTAIGMAYKNHPSILLTGDLALLHDTNGFLIKKHFIGSLTIILINNNGGGIFEMLPIAKFDPPFEDFFATPQNIDFSKLCHTYGVNYHLSATWKDFIKRLDPLPNSGIQVLEIKCDRSADARWLRENLPRLALQK